MNIIKTIDKYGIPPKWQIYFGSLFILIVFLFFIPDSLFKGVLTQIASIGTLIGMFGGFFHNKHSLSPWGYLFLGSTLFGASYSLLLVASGSSFVDPFYRSILVEIGMILLLFFAFNIVYIYEKRLNLAGVTVDLFLITISLIIFALFIHPNLLNTIVYETNLLQKLFFSQVIFSVQVLFMSILLNVLYKGKRLQLLLLIPMSLLLLGHFVVQINDVFYPHERTELFSPLFSIIFVLTGYVVAIFCFIETFSEFTITENHLEIEKAFIQFSKVLMRVAIILASIVIPVALIIRILTESPKLSISTIAIPLLLLAFITVKRFLTIIKHSQAIQERNVSFTQTDRLTGLLNYAGLYDHLSNKDINSLLIIAVNIDDFKSTNKYYGRKFADQILIGFAQKIQSLPGAIASARIGSDNFIIAYETDKTSVKAKTSQVISKLGNWDLVMKKKVPVLLTFGSCFTSNAKKLEEKLRDAEHALIKARTMHVNHHHFNDPDNVQELPRHELQMILQQAVDNNYLPVHFQPIYNLNDGSLKALELLIRVKSEKYGMLQPKQFLEQAHSYGLLTALTKVCIKMVAEYSEQLPKVIININLAPYILQCSETLTDLIDYINELKLDPNTICFEITEDENIRSDTLITQVKYLTDNHFTIAMDDFGTGYSSLERLSIIPFDSIKIDRSLLQAATNGDNTILENSIGLIKRLGESVVVEGVESLEQLSLLKKMGADSVQGFLFSKPIPIFKIQSLPNNISNIIPQY